MQPETNASVLSNLKETLYPTPKVVCRNKLHDLSDPDSRYANGRCKICRLANHKRYRNTVNGREAARRQRYAEFKARLIIRMIVKQNQIDELERQLND